MTRLAKAAAVLAAGALLAACSGGAGGSGGTAKPGAIAVKAGEKTCEVSATKLAPGRHTFAIENTASQVTEVYVYGSGDQIMGEVENIGPATRRELIVDLPAGAYEVACKPGMSGSGIRTALTVEGEGAASATTLAGAAALDAAVAGYRGYVLHETEELVEQTEAFTAAVKAGKADEAKRLYPAARLHYERIEPIAESFGQLDPLIDMRIDDATDGTPFVGFHRLEQDLWQRRDISKSGPVADALLASVRKLEAAVPSVPITAVTMGNGARSLLDEVAKSKVTGEEERYSRIDLVDFQGNVEGARAAWTAVRAVVSPKDADLAATLDARFDSLLDLLASHTVKPGAPGSVPGTPFIAYDHLGKAEIKALAVAVDSLSEPLGKLAGVLAKA